MASHRPCCQEPASCLSGQGGPACRGAAHLGPRPGSGPGAGDHRPPRDPAAPPPPSWACCPLPGPQSCVSPAAAAAAAGRPLRPGWLLPLLGPLLPWDGEAFRLGQARTRATRSEGLGKGLTPGSPDTRGRPASSQWRCQPGLPGQVRVLWGQQDHCPADLGLWRQGNTQPSSLGQRLGTADASVQLATGAAQPEHVPATPGPPSTPALYPCDRGPSQPSVQGCGIPD